MLPYMLPYMVPYVAIGFPSETHQRIADQYWLPIEWTADRAGSCFCRAEALMRNVVLDTHAFHNIRIQRISPHQ